MIPQVQKRASNQHFVFQQDRATSYTARDNIKYLEDRVPELIKREWWPKSSPDLNSLDYAIWSILEQIVYCVLIKDIEQLKKRIVDCWKEVTQDVVNKSINQFTPFLQKMLEAERKRFEHMLYILKK